MQKYQNNVTSRTGDAVSGLQVTVSLAAGGLATIYADNAGTPKDNPLTTDADGYFEFYTADGRYNITVNGGGYDDVLIADALQIGTEASTASAKADSALAGLLERPTSSALAASGGAALVGASYEASSTAITLPATTLQFFMRSAPIDVRVALPGSFVTDASVDYSIYVQKILDYFRDFGGGRLLLPPNVAILVSALRAYSGVEILANDWTSELVVVPGGYGISVNPGSAGTTNPDDNQRNIRFCGFQIRGQAATPTFSEQKHLLNLNAISSSLFEDMLIKGFQGDGVYLGSSNTAGVERHNEGITFRRIRLDGVNRENRNAVSIIDGTNIVLDEISVYRSTKSTMPAAIDIEPNANAFHRIRNVSIENLYVEDCRAGYFVQVLNNLTDPISRVSLRNFKMVNVDVPLAAASSYNTTPLTKLDPVQNIVIENGTAKGGTTPMIVYGQRGLLMQNLSFEDFTGSALVGDSTFTRVRSFGVSLKNTSWLRCGSTSGSALKVDGITDLVYDGNKHMDCGDNTATGCAVEFIPAFAGAVTIASFRDNAFDKSALANMQAVRETGAGTVTANYRDIASNVFNGQTSIFLDDKATDFTPTVVGSGTAGVGTYTNQRGRWTRRGNKISFAFNVTWTAHTGAGNLTFSLPVPAVSGANIPSVQCTINTETVAYTAGKTIGVQVLAGTSTLQVIQSATGVAIAVVALPAAGAALVTGEYECANP